MLNKKTMLLFFVLSGFFIFLNSFTEPARAVTCPADDPSGIKWDNSSGACVPMSGTGLPTTVPGKLAGAYNSQPIVDVANNVMLWILRIIGVAGIAAFAISGIQYLTASGSDDLMEAAKRNMQWSIVGVIVALSGMVILAFIESMLS